MICIDHQWAFIQVLGKSLKNDCSDIHAGKGDVLMHQSVKANHQIRVLRAIAWFCIFISVIGLCAFSLLSKTYLGNGQRSQTSLSNELRSLETGVQGHHIALTAAFEHMNLIKSLLVNDVLDYLRLMCLVLVVLMGVSIAILGVLRPGGN